MNCIDNTYEEHLLGKFGMAKAWHVTTKLAMGLVLEINKPRDRALNSFTENRRSMSKIIFYLVLKSLDVMSRISALDYMDLLVVLTESMKCLSRHFYGDS